MLTMHGISSMMASGGGGGQTVIGGREYRVVTMPDGREWMAENLDFLPIDGSIALNPSGNPTTPSAWYYNNDEATYGEHGNKYGLLYNWYAVKYLEDHKSELIHGWHLPSMTEWGDLSTAVGGYSVAGTKLKSTTGWDSGKNGDDSYGFAAFPAGNWYSGSFYSLGKLASFWTATEYPPEHAYYRYLQTGASLNSNHTDKTIAYSVRLVKDD